MKFENRKVGWSSSVQIDKTKNFQYQEYLGFPKSYIHYAADSGAISRYSS